MFSAAQAHARENGRVPAVFSSFQLMPCVSRFADQPGGLEEFRNADFGLRNVR